MFDCVKMKIVVVGLFYYLVCLVFDFFGYCMIVEIDIGVYQIVKVVEFIIDLFILFFVGVIVDDFKYIVFCWVFDVVNVVKIFVVLDKL